MKLLILERLVLKLDAKKWGKNIRTSTRVPHVKRVSPGRRSGSSPTRATSLIRRQNTDDYWDFFLTLSYFLGRQTELKDPVVPTKERGEFPGPPASSGLRLQLCCSGESEMAIFESPGLHLRWFDSTVTSVCDYSVDG